MSRPGTWTARGREIRVQVAPMQLAHAKLDLDGESSGAGNLVLSVAPKSLRVFVG